MAGRRTLYTPEIAERLLTELSRGRALRAVCRDEDMPPYGAVRQWITDNREGFAARYDRARSVDSTGCPSLYTPELADRILRDLASNRALDAICRDPGLPSASAVREWVRTDRDGFAARYDRARDTGRARPGPPTTYDAVTANWILEQMAGGRPLTHVCSDPRLPAHTTVRHWARENHDGFAARFKRARRLCIEALGDQMIDIADTCHEDWIRRKQPDGAGMNFHPESIARARLRCRTRRWLMVKVIGRTPEGRMG